MKVITVDRRSAVLTRSSLACLSGVASINLTGGCAHGCVYCYTRGYSNYPGQDAIRFYANTPKKLAAELAARRRHPEVVYFSPASDLFQPVPEVLDLAWATLKLLLESRIPVAFLTKGKIPSRHMRLLAEYAPLVRAQIGLITLDEPLRKTFEPNAAPCSVRIDQARALTDAKIATTGRLDPILPGLTDSDDAFEQICSRFRNAGINSLAAGVLFLRPAILHSLKRNLKDPSLRKSLLEAFNSATRLPIHAENSSVTALPADQRQAIFDRLSAVARRHDIRVYPCACKNPDIASGGCHIAGQLPEGSGGDPQLELFDRSPRKTNPRVSSTRGL